MSCGSPRAKRIHAQVWRSVMDRLLPRAPGAAGAMTYAIDRALGVFKRRPVVRDDDLPKVGLTLTLRFAAVRGGIAQG